MTRRCTSTACGPPHVSIGAESGAAAAISQDLASGGSGASGDRVNGEEAQMVEMIRHCPDCGSDRQFGQLHPDPGTCPDSRDGYSRDGYCPEWSCTACGTGLLIGFITFMYESSGIADPRVRVA